MKKINSIEDFNKIFDSNEEIEENSISSNNIKGCKAGFTITKEIEEFDKLKTKIFKYISYKKRTENEIRQKFVDADENMLEDAIEYFKEQNYINEDEYIDRSVKEFLKLKKLSIKELTYKLIQKGINKNSLDNYILNNKELLLEYEINSAKKIILKKKDKTEIEEIKRYLYQKGYMQESISIALDEIS